MSAYNEALGEAQIPSDLDCINKFVNDLSTIIYTHNGMEYELYQAMNALKSSADEMRKMIYDEQKTSRGSTILGKLNVYYYPETIKILRTYFDNYELLKGDAGKKQSILNSCKSVQDIILKKKQEFFDAAHPMDFDVAFLEAQVTQDMKGNQLSGSPEEEN